MNDFVVLNNGVHMPIIGLGTYKICGSENVTSAVKSALETGYRSFDTASVYRNEEDIGEAMRQYLPVYGLQRNEIFITTKLGPADHGLKACEDAINRSLQKLSMDYIDLYLIHWPGVQGLQPSNSSAIKLRKESWLQMEEDYRNGKLKAIGVSNYTVAHLKEVLSYCTVKPTVLQIEYHPHLIQRDIFAFCKENGIHLQAYSSLGTSSNKQLLSDPVVNEIASRHDRTAAQVLLKWALQQGIGVIPKAVGVEHIKSNWNLKDFTLGDQDILQLNALDEQHHYCWNPQSIE